MSIFGFRKRPEPLDEASVERLFATPTPVPEADLSRGQERLMAALWHARTSVKGERPAMHISLSRKGFAFASAGLLAVGAVGTVGASGGVSDAAGNVGDVLAALHVTDRTPDVADEHIDAIEQPDAPSGHEQAGEPSENANDNASEGADNADDGIGNSSASENGLDHAAENASEGSGNADSEHGPTALPTQAIGDGNSEPGVPDNANVPPDVDLPDDATDPPGREP
jgi:hypothetical protein